MGLPFILVWQSTLCNSVDPDQRTEDAVFAIQTLTQHLSINGLAYRSRPNYHTYPNKCTVKQCLSVQTIALYTFIYFFIKAYVADTNLNCLNFSYDINAGTHLNWLNLSRQFKLVSTACFINHINTIKYTTHEVGIINTYLGGYFTASFSSTFESPKCTVL